MATIPQLVHGAVQGVASHAPQRDAAPDQGPWLFLVAPFSFALVLVTVVHLAGLSF